MDKSAFRRWLEKCPVHPRRRLKLSTIDTYVTDAARVEKHYGLLEIQYEKDQFAGFLRDPSKIPTTEKGISGYKTAIRHYREFLDYRMQL